MAREYANRRVTVDNNGDMIVETDAEVLARLKRQELMTLNARLIALAPELAEWMRAHVMGTRCVGPLSTGPSICDCAWHTARALLARLDDTEEGR